jgi:hypothetical protein
MKSLEALLAGAAAGLTDLAALFRASKPALSAQHRFPVHWRCLLSRYSREEGAAGQRPQLPLDRKVGEIALT